jgi:hypothetical protein
MKEDCIASQGPQRTVVPEEEEEEGGVYNKNTMMTVTM